MTRFVEIMSRHVRAIARFAAIELAGRVLYYTGILFLIGRLRQYAGRRRLIIPMYHRVCGAGDSIGRELLGVQRGVPIELFERHLRVFRWFGKLLTLDRAYDHLLDPTKMSRSTIALTFDDGYRDIVQLAVPVLLRHSVPATLFPVVRTASGGRPLWWDELIDLLLGAPLNRARLAHYLADLDEGQPGLTERDSVAPKMSLQASAGLLCERLLELSTSRRERVLTELAHQLNGACRAGSGPRLYANWEELKAVSNAGVEIGGHTLDHAVLPREESIQAELQIAGGRKAMQQLLERPVRSFAYPNGRHDASVRALVAAAGYRVAVTVEHGVNYADADPYQLRRMPVGCERPFHLALKLAFYGWAYRGLESGR